MTVGLSCFAGVGWQLFDDNGVPLSGGLLYTYEAGTTTPAATYTTYVGNVAHANPIVLDAAGRVPSGEIWLTSTTIYKFVVRNSDGVLIATYDNLPAVATANDIAAFANASDPTKGDALIGFRQSNTSGNLPDTVNRTVHTKLQEFISIKDFGAVGDGVTNDTNAIQNALDQANKKTVIFPSGQYLIDSLEVNQQFTSIWSQGAELILNPTGTYTHAMKIATTGSFCTITGSLTFDGGLNSNYDSTFWVKGGYGKFENINFRFCKLAMLIGEAGVNQVSLSEMFFSKIATNGCRNALEMHGLFTVANFTDCLLAGNENPAWNGQDGTTIKNFGGRIYYENGYLYGGPESDPTLKPHIEINQIEYAGIFHTGSIYLNNLDSESYGKPFLQVNNLSTVNNAPTSGDVFICNSRIDFFGYAALSPQPIPFYFNNFYTGSFKTVNNRFKFFDNMTRRPIEIGANTRAQINVEDIVSNLPYYGTNAIVYPGLPPQIPFQTVLSVTMNNAFTAGSGGGAQPVIFDTKRVGIQGNRITLSDNYDTSTGVFTVPQGGLNSIMVIANYRVSGALGAGAVSYVRHVSSSGGFTRIYGYQPIVALGGQVIANISEAAEGDEITFMMDTQNSGAALEVGANFNNQMTISAYITTPNT